MKADTNSNDQSESVRDRCLAYLLGEMTPQQASTFEAGLVDPVLADALLRESDLLCAVAMSDSSAHTHFKSRSVSIRQIASLVATLAAAILVFVAYRFSKESESNPNDLQVSAAPAAELFDLQVAKTWVDPAIDWDADVRENIAVTAIDDIFNDVDDTDVDETFEWMVAAVEASIDLGDDQNDG
ncbi:MAG: hypothetical protein KDB00_26425 [Planctomycetales bacterium]|nr:hypothetical protein [Planctomycetales bacterium]